MKTLFAIIISSALAAVICLALVSTGIISFKKNDAEPLKTEIKKAEAVFHKVQDIMPKIPPEKTPETLPEPLPETGIQDIIFNKVTAFLQSAIENGTADIEDQFKKFLKEEQKLDEKSVQKFLKMSFWKNFVTLQNIKETDDYDKIRLEFAREMELKKAGFAAKGIVLMKSEIESAEKELETRLKVEGGKIEGEKVEGRRLKVED
ncbi:hypothetical protein BuS5_02480 [Desulfosarcina sp. BuS5]|uniref:hypothetical protein n=1 Tax=Desulfosarcina sp. BuS5 TaxID=933262 RepID=UPI0004827409|nr:hypothetical protein [Desulfosarcina sp. BuS5]WDN89512.1 hypothetical protein BuS5_02480 [Desulfosarcina sp. BuS5]